MTRARNVGLQGRARKRLKRIFLPRCENVRRLLVPFVPPLRPLDSGFRRNDDPGDLWDSEALSKPRNILFVPIAHPGWRRHTKV